MKSLLRLGLVALGLLLAPTLANAAACVTTAYAKTAGAWSNTTTTWATTSGGATACTLTASNAVVFDANSGAGTYTIDENISIDSLDTTNAPAGTILAHNLNDTLTVLNTVSNIFLLSANVTYAPAAARAIAFTDTGGTTTITTNGQTLGTVTFNGVGGDFVLAGGTFAASGGITLTNGTLDASVNNVNVTTASVSSSNANTRVLNCGTGTWTLNALTGTVWGFSTTTNLTESCTGAVIVIAPTAVQLA